MWYNLFMKKKEKKEESAKEEVVETTDKTGVNHPDYDPSLPLNKQRHIL